MLLNSLHNPFESTVLNPKLSKIEKGRKLIAIYDREKKSAMKLQGGYSIAKINWLMQLLQESQKQIL